MRVSCVRACEGTLEGHRFAAWLLCSRSEAPRLSKRPLGNSWASSSHRGRGNSLFHRSACFRGVFVHV